MYSGFTEAKKKANSKYLKNTDLKVTRIAQGISFGSDIEYVDEVTLSRAISGRIEI